LESKPGDLYLGSWKPHGLNDVENQTQVKLCAE